MEWSDDVIGQLRALWDEGHSTAEIGRRLGVTKNAIVGKAHRLDLPARPSPIRRDPDAAPVRRTPVRRVEGPTLPPLPSAVADGDAGLPVFGDTPLTVRRPDFGPVLMPGGVAPAAPRPPVMARPAVATPSMPRPVVHGTRAVAVPPPRPVAAAPRPYGRVVTCCWPIGEPGTREFHFCDVPSEPGRPYCEDHVKVAYVKVRDRREDAA
jgi:GcrA cell cycle regulator